MKQITKIKKDQNMLTNILSSGFTFAKDEYELKTKYILFNSMLVTVAIVLIIMGFFRLSTAYYTQGIIDFGVSVIALAYIVVLRLLTKGQYKVMAYLMIVILSVIIMYSYYLSAGELKINAWFTALVIPIFFILGYRVAMFLALLFMVGIATVNFNLENTDILNTVYGYVPLFMTVLFLNIYELRFKEFTQLLTDSNSNLESKVKMKTKERTVELENQKNALDYQAHHDYLTGLPNRVKFQKEIEKTMSQSKNTDRNVAILFIDLDHFKNINDSFGHNIGDKVIKIIANRIQQCIRADSCLARFGGDEFVILVNDYYGKKYLEAISENILASISQAIMIDSMTLFLSCSIGISVYNDEIDSSQNFIKYAFNHIYGYL